MADIQLLKSHVAQMWRMSQQVNDWQVCYLLQEAAQDNAALRGRTEANTALGIFSVDDLTTLAQDKENIVSIRVSNNQTNTSKNK